MFSIAVYKNGTYIKNKLNLSHKPPYEKAVCLKFSLVSFTLNKPDKTPPSAAKVATETNVSIANIFEILLIFIKMLQYPGNYKLTEYSYQQNPIYKFVIYQSIHFILNLLKFKFKFIVVKLVSRQVNSE